MYDQELFFAGLAKPEEKQDFFADQYTWAFSGVDLLSADRFLSAL
jgi:hypothetical protein